MKSDIKPLDSKRICEVEGCNNLGRWSKVINHKLYRSPLCDTHHKQKYEMSKNISSSSKLKTIQRFKRTGASHFCEICGWEGPCDVHRIKPQGKYNWENMMSTCPNCHRLLHLGLITLTT